MAERGTGIDTARIWPGAARQGRLIRRWGIRPTAQGLMEAETGIEPMSTDLQSAA